MLASPTASPLGQNYCNNGSIHAALDQVAIYASFKNGYDGKFCGLNFLISCFLRAFNRTSSSLYCFWHIYCRTSSNLKLVLQIYGTSYYYYSFILHYS